MQIYFILGEDEYNDEQEQEDEEEFEVYEEDEAEYEEQRKNEEEEKQRVNISHFNPFKHIPLNTDARV